MPNRFGSATTSSTGTPSTVTPYARRAVSRRPRAEPGGALESLGLSSTDTIAGSDSKARKTGAALSAGTTTANRSLESLARRGSPAGMPPSGAAISSSSRLARWISSPRGGRGSSTRSSAASSFASFWGPIPGTSRSRPAVAASLSSAAVRTPSVRAISTACRAPIPR